MFVAALTLKCCREFSPVPIVFVAWRLVFQMWLTTQWGARLELKDHMMTLGQDSAWTSGARWPGLRSSCTGWVLGHSNHKEWQFFLFSPFCFPSFHLFFQLPVFVLAMLSDDLELSRQMLLPPVYWGCVDTCCCALFAWLSFWFSFKEPKGQPTTEPPNFYVHRVLFGGVYLECFAQINIYWYWGEIKKSLETIVRLQKNF